MDDSAGEERPQTTTIKMDKVWKTVEFVTTTNANKRPAAQTTPKPEKGKHIRKTSEKQKKELISYFEANPSYVHVVAGAVGDNAMKNKIWASVAKRLNEVKGGVTKSPAKWSKSWADMKVYAKARAKLAIQGQAPPNSKKPSELDRRILMVIGQEELLSNWDQAVSDDALGGGGGGSGSSRQATILEHDYQNSGFQLDGSEVVEEEYTVEEHETGQQHVIVKNLPELMKQLKQEQQQQNQNHHETMEFYIDDDIEEEVAESDEQEHEVVEEILAPMIKRQKVSIAKEEFQHHHHPRVVEIEERPDTVMAEAIKNLADALNNVAGALYAAADTIKLLKT